MKEIDINGQKYSVDRMDAMTQFHVSRRVLPVLAAMGISVATLRKGLQLDAADMALSLGPVSQVVSNMPDDQVEYVMGTCLAQVRRKQGKDWSPVSVNGGQLLFADIDMAVMLRLVWAVMQENLGGFLQELPETGQSASS